MSDVSQSGQMSGSPDAVAPNNISCIADHKTRRSTSSFPGATLQQHSGGALEAARCQRGTLSIKRRLGLIVQVKEVWKTILPDALVGQLEVGN